MTITWNTPSVLPTMSWCIHQSVYGVSRHDLVTKSIPFVCLRFEKYFLSFDRFCRPTAIILLTFGLLKVIIIRKDSNAIPRKTMLAIFYKKYQSGEQLLMKVGLLHWDICPWNGVGEQCYVTGVIGITRSWKFLKSLILLPKMKFSWYQVGQWQCFYYIKVQIRQKTFTFLFRCCPAESCVDWKSSKNKHKVSNLSSDLKLTQNLKPFHFLYHKECPILIRICIDFNFAVSLFFVIYHRSHKIPLIMKMWGYVNVS